MPRQIITTATKLTDMIGHRRHAKFLAEEDSGILLHVLQSQSRCKNLRSEVK